VRRLAIRVRLALAFLAVMAVVLAAAGLVVYLRVERALDRTLSAELRSQAAQAESALRSGTGPARFVNAETAETFTQVIDRDGQVIQSDSEDWRRPVLSAQRASHLPAAGGTFDASPVGESDERWRVLAVPVSGDRAVIVGRSRQEHDEALGTLRAQLLIGGAIVLACATLAGFRLAGAALRPVELMRRRAADISASTPGHRLPVAESRDEVSRLGETLNDMLERLDAALAHERAFVANASHQLRTPLARLKAELESAVQRQRSPAEYEAVLHSAIRETDRLAQLARDLLALARAEQGTTARRSAVSVGAVFSHLADRFATRARTEGREVTIGDGTDLAIMGDEVQLEHALGNVVDNALRYGAGPVRLSAVGRSPLVELHVTDEGPGFPDAFLPLAFDRFTRADTGRDDGSGLGLAIVQMIALAHDGAAGIANRPTGGADIAIAVPAVTRSLAAAAAVPQADRSDGLQSMDSRERSTTGTAVPSVPSRLIPRRRGRPHRPDKPTAG
jgi:signal transduction histidine kinase